MADPSDHATCVDAWIKQASDGRTATQLLPPFEQALGRLWRRANRTLADVTLVAIVDRVLHTTAENSPLLSTLKVETSGFLYDELRENARAADPKELVEGMRFVLVEFLTVVGDLTADILTPALHAELSSTTLSPGHAAARRAAGKRSSAKTKRKA
jgi:hypothetical protein